MLQADKEVKNWGNSLVIIISSDERRIHKIEKGDIVKVTIEETKDE